MFDVFTNEHLNTGAVQRMGRSYHAQVHQYRAFIRRRSAFLYSGAMIFCFGVLAIYIPTPGGVNGDVCQPYPTICGVVFSLAGPVMLSAGALFLALGACLPRKSSVSAASSRRGTTAGVTPSHSTTTFTNAQSAPKKKLPDEISIKQPLLADSNTLSPNTTRKWSSQPQLHSVLLSVTNELNKLASSEKSRDTPPQQNPTGFSFTTKALATVTGQSCSIGYEPRTRAASSLAPPMIITTGTEVLANSITTQPYLRHSVSVTQKVDEWIASCNTIENKLSPTEQPNTATWENQLPPMTITSIDAEFEREMSALPELTIVEVDDTPNKTNVFYEEAADSLRIGNMGRALLCDNRSLEEITPMNRARPIPDIIEQSTSITKSASARFQRKKSRDRGGDCTGDSRRRMKRSKSQGGGRKSLGHRDSKDGTVDRLTTQRERADTVATGSKQTAKKHRKSSRAHDPSAKSSSMIQIDDSLTNQSSQRSSQRSRAKSRHKRSTDKVGSQIGCHKDNKTTISSAPNPTQELHQHIQQSTAINASAESRIAQLQTICDTTATTFKTQLQSNDIMPEITASRNGDKSSVNMEPHPHLVNCGQQRTNPPTLVMEIKQ